MLSREYHVIKDGIRITWIKLTAGTKDEIEKKLNIKVENLRGDWSINSTIYVNDNIILDWYCTNHN
jgi:hypothetical protein